MPSNDYCKIHIIMFSERIIVVSEVIGKSLKELTCKFTFDDVSMITLQVVNGLSHLHNMGITHRTLSPDNILLDENNNVKLFNYGMYYMTGGGAYVSFPLG